MGEHRPPPPPMPRPPREEARSAYGNSLLRFEEWPAGRLMAEEFPEPRWAVPGIVAEGLNLLVGAPKLGKSWAALAVAVAVAAGGKAFGKLDTEAADVLYLALEDVPRRLQSRLKMYLDGAEVPERLTFVTEWPGPDGLEIVGRWLEAHPDAGLVIVDVLARTRGSKSTSESSYDADYRAIVAWKAIADRWNVPVIVVHHTRKAASEDFLDAVSGTNGLAGAADAILVMKRSRGSADAEMHVTGRDVVEAAYALRFDPASGAWSLLDGPAEDYTTTPQRREILRVLRDGGPLGPKAIAEQSGVDHATVKHLVRKMVDGDQLDTDGNGLYFTREPVHPVHSVHPDGEQGERSEQVDPPPEELEF